MKEEEKKFIEDLKGELKRFTKDIPIKWDRVIDGENYLIFYGWVDNEKRGRDFIHFIYVWDEVGCSIIYSTSSVKFTNKINENLGNPPDDHSPCIKFQDYFKGIGGY